MIITIDGPTAAGKSTVARKLAKYLNYYYLYSGYLYRALAYVLLKKFGKNTLEQITQKEIENILDPKKFNYIYDHEKGERILIENQDITPFLKEAAIDQIASQISGYSFVRKFLFDLQRSIAQEEKNLIVDGRDSGSVVFPDAQLKLYITADSIERARRWQKQQHEKGKSVSLPEAIKHLHERDERDAQRAQAPMVIPEGALVVDSTHLDEDELFEKVINLLDA